MTQVEMVVDHMNRFGSITRKEASDKYGIYDLPARIRDAKKQGYIVFAETIKGTNRFGKKCHFVKYRLAEQSDFE